MAFTAAILTEPEDYSAIRDLLGVDSTDLPNDTVDLLPYLPAAESIVKARIATYATILGTENDTSYNLRAGTQLVCAARLAVLRYVPRTGDELLREQVLTESWQYRTGPDWQALADQYAKEANKLLVRVETGGDYGSAPIVSPGVAAGPTQYRRSTTLASNLQTGTPRSVSEWLSQVYAPVVDPYEPRERLT